MRKRYLIRFTVRLAVFAAVLTLYFLRPQDFAVLNGLRFFSQFSLLHLLWLVWMGDMLLQLLPIRWAMALGSQKQFRRYFHPTAQTTVPREVRHQNNLAALRVFLLWAVIVAGIGFLHTRQVLGRAELLLVTVFFYVSDLVCVLFWCPFQLLFLKNRCCTTCRIFNWDHLMMFAPLLFTGGFFGWSLVGAAVVVFLVWEVCAALHPERFWEGTNAALRCANCSDKLCGKHPVASL